MTQQIPESDRKYFGLLPVIVTWIQSNRKFTDREIIAFTGQYPDHFGTDSDHPLDEMFEMASKYLDNPAYGKGMRVIVSPEGRRWLEELSRQIHETKANSEKETPLLTR